MTTRIILLISLIACIAKSKFIYDSRYEPCLEIERQNAGYCEVKYWRETVTLDQLLHECENQGGNCSVVTRNGYRAIRVHVPRCKLTFFSLVGERGREEFRCTGSFSYGPHFPATFYEDTDVCVVLISKNPPHQNDDTLVVHPTYEPCLEISRENSGYCEVKYWRDNVTLDQLLRECQKQSGNCSIVTRNGYRAIRLNVPRRGGNVTFSSLLRETGRMQDWCTGNYNFFSHFQPATFRENTDVCLVLVPKNSLVTFVKARYDSTYAPCLEINRQSSTKGYCEMKYWVETLCLDQLLQECENQGGNCSIVSRNGYHALWLDVLRDNVTFSSLEREFRRSQRSCIKTGNYTRPDGHATFYENTDVCVVLVSENPVLLSTTRQNDVGYNDFPRHEL